MDQESSNKSGSRGSWRDRLGINEDSGPARTASDAPVARSAKPAEKADAKVVSKPAPMAPRPGASVKARERTEVSDAPAAAKKAHASQRPAPARAAQDDAFAERLRQHRAAAEEAVKKRSSGSSLNKFSFAKDEVKNAEAEKEAETPKPVEPVAPKPADQQQVAPAPKSPVPVAPPVAQVPQTAAPIPARPPGPAPVAAPAPVHRPVQSAPQAPRPPQYAPPAAPQASPYGQPAGYGQQPPAYRPQGPGYAPPPGSRPQPPQGYATAPYGRPGQASGQGMQRHAPQPAPAPRYAPPSGEDDIFEDNGYRPAAPLGRQPASSARGNDTFRAEFDDPFEDGREYGGRTASDYSKAYREYDDDFEEEQPRRWGGLIMLILALLTIAALAAGLIVYYQSNKTGTGTSTGEVPTIGAPEQPAKAAPDASAEQPASAPAQGKKLIYDRILGSDAGAQPERIVPREETPQQPVVPSNEGNTLPLPLPPPPGTQGSLTPGTAGPEPAQQTTSIANTDQQTQGAVGVEPAASAVLAPVVRSGSIASPPVPRRKPRNLVASIQQAPATQFRPVLQPAPAPAPQQLLPQQQTAVVPPQAPVPEAVPTTRRAGRDDDPLAGLRAPLNAGSQASQGAPQVLQRGQQVAVAPQPVPQKPISSQSLQSFAPPAPAQQQAAAPTGTGYVVQLAAYRSEQEAMGQYQQLKARHGNLVGNLPPAVQQTNLGASGTFYRLGMGPMSSKQAATELCNKLIAAGERDCLVRRR